MEEEIKYDPIKVVLAVNEPGGALIVGYHTTHAYDHWFDEGTPYATDNGFQEAGLPKEPGLYNCTAQPRWEGDDENGEMFFDITSMKQIARFTEGSAIVTIEIDTR